jgi:hypothetical protein
MANYFTSLFSYPFLLFFFFSSLTNEDALSSLFLGPQFFHLAFKAGQQGIWVKINPEIVFIGEKKRD